MLNTRSSRAGKFCKKCVHKTFEKFTEKGLYQSLIFNEVLGPNFGTVFKSTFFYNTLLVAATETWDELENLCIQLPQEWFWKHFWVVRQRRNNTEKSISQRNLAIRLLGNLSLLAVSFLSFLTLNVSSHFTILILAYNPPKMSLFCYKEKFRHISKYFWI